MAVLVSSARVVFCGENDDEVVSDSQRSKKGLEIRNETDDTHSNL